MKKIIVILLALLPITTLAQFAPSANFSKNNTANTVPLTKITQEVQKQKVYNQGEMFNFQENSDVLYSNYKNNQKALKWLSEIIAKNQLSIISDRAYFEIIAFIPEHLKDNPQAVNKAATQAQVLRTFLVTQYKIPAHRCTFSIDTTQGLQNTVNLQLISGKPSKHDNFDIHYTPSQSTTAAQNAMDKYKDGVPYISYLMHLAKHNVNFSSDAEIQPLNLDQPAENVDQFINSAKLSQIARLAGIPLYTKSVTNTFNPASDQQIDTENVMLYRFDNNNFVYTTAQDIYTLAKGQHNPTPDQSYQSSLPILTQPLVQYTQQEIQQQPSQQQIAQQQKVLENQQTQQTQQYAEMLKAQQIAQQQAQHFALQQAQNQATIQQQQKQTELDKYYLQLQEKEKQLEIQKQQLTQQQMQEAQQRTANNEYFNLNQQTEPQKAAKVQNLLDYSRTKPIFGLKTNLLSWCIGVPNLQMEFFFGKGMSANVEAAYTYLNPIFGQHNSYFMWDVGAELRFWTKRDKRFEKFFIGPYFKTGQYDLKFSEIGNQGDYWSAGLVLGYLVPIKKHFNMEFSIGGGYYSYNNTKYYFSEADNKFVVHNEKNPVNTKCGIFPAKATVSLVWKF